MGTENYKRILILCAVLAVGIVAISVIFTLKGDDKDKGKKNGKGTANEKFDPDGTVNGRTPQDVIIKNIDLDSSEITVEDIETGENRKLVFTGGSDIRTKTGRIISAAMLGVGNIVKITSDEENKLISLYGHDKVWSYKNIERIRIEENPKKIEVGNSIYRYDRLNVLNEDEFIDIKSLITDGTDVLDMYGIDDRVYLIKVNTGHGYLTLMNQEDFTGGTISYGVGKSTEITEDIKLTLREGDYNIRIEKDGNEAAATVRIKNNETTAFDLTGYGLEPVTYQEITFKISPEESDLYIDGVKTPFKDPVKLSIGHHEIEAVLGGYNDYKGSIEVGDGSTVKMISLSPAPEEKPEDIVYDDTPPEEEDKESDSTDVTPTAPPVNDS
ncbi:MAG: PEGA domain-containing protein [Lachnospiraceae bacterium]|nr:PEGA domain-containing protein [Lachnospiraceae bacterium]